MTPRPNGERAHLSKYDLQPFELWVAIAAVVSALSYFFLPRTVAGSAVALVVPQWQAHLWNVLYGLGGVGVMAGFWRASPRLEGAGLCLLASGVTVSSLALLYVRGWNGVVGFFVTVGVAVACMVRLRVLVRLSP